MAKTTENPLKRKIVSLIAASAETTWAIGASLTANGVAGLTA